MKKIICVLLISFMLFGCSSSTLVSGKVTCNQKNQLVKEESILIDVRTKEEYDSFHLDGAINIPYDSIDKINDYINVTKDKKIIVYCASGVRSNKAFVTLKNLGFTNIYDLGSINNCM